MTINVIDIETEAEAYLNGNDFALDRILDEYTVFEGPYTQYGEVILSAIENGNDRAKLLLESITEKVNQTHNYVYKYEYAQDLFRHYLETRVGSPEFDRLFINLIKSLNVSKKLSAHYTMVYIDNTTIPTSKFNFLIDFMTEIMFNDLDSDELKKMKFKLNLANGKDALTEFLKVYVEERDCITRFVLSLSDFEITCQTGDTINRIINELKHLDDESYNYHLTSSVFTTSQLQNIVTYEHGLITENLRNKNIHNVSYFYIEVLSMVDLDPLGYRDHKTALDQILTFINDNYRELKSYDLQNYYNLICNLGYGYSFATNFDDIIKPYIKNNNKELIDDLSSIVNRKIN